MKRLVLSVTKDDCIMDTFTVSGHGGGGKDTSNTGVRFRHPPSGAVGEGREERSQKANKKKAWERMARSQEMQEWIRRKVYDIKTPEEIMAMVDAQIEQGLRDGSIIIEEM